ncbi:hypothetical protein [Micromonospora sp. NPDC005367]|uniref:hypothetical protein n=1 Tax=Micromonospora sp. NPDC005367 TaxID=3155590 RepID=UPI0033AE9462
MHALHDGPGPSSSAPRSSPPGPGRSRNCWTGPVEELFVRLGFDDAEARRRARLGLAATGGLLLDLLITGDRETLDSAAELFARIINAPPPMTNPVPAQDGRTN